MNDLKIHIEVADVNQEYAFCYSSQVIPHIGEEITWFKSGKRIYARVAKVTHEIMQKSTQNVCQRVWVEIEEITVYT